MNGDSAQVGCFTILLSDPAFQEVLRNCTGGFNGQEFDLVGSGSVPFFRNFLQSFEELCFEGAGILAFALDSEGVCGAVCPLYENLSWYELERGLSLNSSLDVIL